VVFKPKHTTEQQLRDGFVRLWKEFFSKVDFEESLSSFHQKIENILKSREFSQKVKDAVARGMKKHAMSFTDSQEAL
jgi:response regulator of citrate/malate metabolism